MKINGLKAGFLAGVAFAGVGYAAPALAQGAEGSGDSDAIIVTARRTEEKLQDVPISITVYNQEAISNRNVVTATDLATYTPSLAVNQRFGPEKAQFAIRGFNQGNSEAPTVGVYFADVVSTRAQGGTAGGSNAPIGSFMDLQNVQVLKGPQGTLFGRNTTGGAVLLVPQKPTDRFEGNVEASVGNYGMWRAQGVLNLPVSDTLRFRVAVDRQKRDGYMKNHLANGQRTDKSQDFNDVNYFAARLSMVADLAPDFENYTIVTYSNSFGNSYAGRINVCNRAATAGSVGITGTAACDQITRQNARGDGPFDVEVNNYNPGVNIKHWGVINTTKWEASDSLTIKNILSYSEYREVGQFALNSDNFFISPSYTGGLGPVAAVGTQFNYILLRPFPGQNQAAEKAFTDEIQFIGTAAEGKLNWQAGFYIEINNPIGLNAGRTGILASCSTDALVGGCTPSIPAASSISVSRTKFWFRDKGIYAQMTYKLTDQLSLTGGIRYTWSTTRGESTSTRITLGDGIEACNDIVRFNRGFGPTGRLIALPVSDPNTCRVTIEEKSGEPTWLLGLDYKPNEDLLLYAKYSRGYRSGGVNLTTIGVEGWKPEFVDAYEVGAKYTFSGAVRGYFNIAGFYNKLKEAQLPVSGLTAVPGFSGAQPVINAGVAKIQGIEVDAAITPFKGFKLEAGYTYLDSKLQSIDASKLIPPAGAPYLNPFVPNAVPGSALARSPKNRLTLTGTYTLPVDESVGEISLGVTYTHTDKQVVTLATFDGSAAANVLYSRDTAPGTDFRYAPATDLVNLNVNWNNFMGKPIDLAFFVTNLTNAVYAVDVGSSYNSAGFENQLMGAPRMWGFRMKYRFGD